MKEFDSIEELLAELQGGVSAGNVRGGLISKSDANDILMNEVAPVAMDILHRHISSDIYNAYTPIEFYHMGRKPLPGFVQTAPNYFIYERRYSLLDKGNMVYKIINGDTLFVTSDAAPNRSVIGSPWRHNVGGFLQMIEEHPGKLWPHRFPRPAVTYAQEEIGSSPEIQKAFDAGLKRKGIIK